jgi:hypothetical protein
MSFNPLLNYTQGQQIGQQQHIQRTAGALANEMQNGGNIQKSMHFKELMALDPDRANKAMATFQAISKERKTDLYEDMVTARNLLGRGDTAGALNIFEDRIDALGGPSENAMDSQYYVDSILSGDLNKTMSDLSSGIEAANAIGIGQNSNRQARTAEEKNFAKLEQLKTQGDPQAVSDFSKMIGLTENVKMSSALEKQILKAQDDYFTNDQQARQMKVLADDIQRMDIGGGVSSTTSEKFKSILGSQDEVTELRRRFNAIRTSQAVVNLPPGVASDKDIELALKGFPAENANAMQIISFLKGQEKLAKINANFNKFKAEWFSEKKKPSGLLKAWKMQSGDIIVPEVERDEASIMSQYGL